MARIKSVSIKAKRYVFDVMKNREEAAPMACVFRRFPLPDEDFPYAEPLDLSDEGVRTLAQTEDKEEALRQIIDSFVPKFLENLKNKRIDYQRFVRECIEKFEDIEYEDRQIATVEDFFSLPADLCYRLAQDAYLYATKRDVFSFEEKNGLAKP
jgi:hypothetical protein